MRVRLTTTPLPEYLQDIAEYKDPIATSTRGKNLYEKIAEHNNELRQLAEAAGCNWVVGIVYSRIPEDDSSYAKTFATGTPVYVDCDMGD